jgi:hypothetical protein
MKPSVKIQCHQHGNNSEWVAPATKEKKILKNELPVPQTDTFSK